jgi:2-polyprenyl-3-methyl-5-hydroxy-6-metoxy-1,4-benzoquinol methylase
MLRITIDFFKKMFQSKKNKETAYYKQMFINNSYWNTPEPNEEEKLRWSIIENFLKIIDRKEIDILDLGCGRGWLTNLLSNYGNVIGIEPIKPVVDYAKKIFPEINFICGTTKDLLKKRKSKKFDLIVCSEVIEHILDREKANFIDDIFKLLNADGFLIVTTPRKEAQLEWLTYSSPDQPIEDWISEYELEKLISQRGLKKIQLERFSISPKMEAPKIEIYQLWLFQKNNDQ